MVTPREALSIALQLVGVIAPVLALWTYRRSVRTKRAEWLSTLHAKFFESANYKHIRYLLDSHPTELETLRQSIAGNGSDPLQEEFVDYLNFFQFIASLWKLKQLSENEVAMLFDYYLNNLAAHQFIADFMAGNGFERLIELIDAMKRRKG